MESDSSLTRFMTLSQEEDLNSLMISDGILDQELDSTGVLMSADFTVSSSGHQEDRDVKPYNLGLGLSCMDQTMFPPPGLPESGWPVPATMKLPSTERFEGNSGFGLQLHGQHEGKSWIFSIPLNKVFINVGNKFPVQFVWHRASVLEPRVRAVMMFLSPDSVEESVERCNHHSSKSDKSNINFPHVEHVVRCDNPQAQYWTDSVSERHSLVVPLDPPQAGTCGTTILYSFVCKNSCPSGMNRRQTQIVFTLEDVYGQVHGRESMSVRICSCPKRDKDKEEADILKICIPKSEGKTKRLKAQTGNPAALKKPKLLAEPSLFSVPVPTQEEELKVIAFAHGLVLSNVARQKREATATEKEMLAYYESRM